MRGGLSGNGLRGGLAGIDSSADSQLSALGTGLLKNTSGGTLSIAVAGTDYEPALTFSTGLTRTVNTITANLSTGLAGGQTATGGTAASENLTLQSTSHGTKGKIFLGAAAASHFNEASPSLVINNATNDGSFSIIWAKANFSTDGTIGIGNSTGTVKTYFGIFNGLPGVSMSSGNDFVFYGGNEVLRYTYSTLNVLIGSSSDDAATRLKVVASKTVASAVGAVWNGFKLGASTLTLTGNTTPTGILAAAKFEGPTITDATAITGVRAATLWVSGDPAAGGSVTLATGGVADVAAMRVDGSSYLGGVTRIGRSGTEAMINVSSTDGSLSSPNASTRFTWDNTGIGFYASAPIAKPNVTGSRGGNAALASLCTQLANLGLITDSTSA